MNPKKKLILTTIIIFLCFWILDSLIDSSIFYEGHKSFYQLLFLKIPPHDLFIRLFFMMSFTAVTYLLYRYIDKLEKSAIRLKKTEERYYQVFDSKISMKMIIDAETGRIIDANRKAREFFRFDKNSAGDNIMGININFEKFFLNRKFNDPDSKYHYQHRDPSDHIRDLEMHFSYIEHENNNLLYCEMKDITEILELEREIINISEKERQAIGQELHDELGQILTGISYLIEVFEKQLKQKSGTNLSEISQLIDRAVQKTHQLSNGLRPVHIHQRNIDMALEEIVIEIEDMYKIKCDLLIDGNKKINDNIIVTQLYYIAKEALYNAIKHSNIQRITITWNTDGKNFLLSIKSSGTKKSTIKASRGMGINIMKYRAQIIDGDMTISDRINEFTVSVSNRNYITPSSV